MRTTKLFGIFSILFGLFACNGAPEAPLPSEQPAEQTVETSVAVLQQVATSGHHAVIGFDSPADARAAQTAAPLPVFMVRLDHLQAYREGQAPESLLVDLERVFYPVHVGGVIRSSMELSHEGGTWVVSSLGDKTEARMVHEARAQAERAAGTFVDRFILVRVPALRLSFVGHDEGQGLMLAPIADDASLGLHAGQPIAAGEVFTRLVSIAERVDAAER
jgi:hypothetical protein